VPVRIADDSGVSLIEVLVAVVILGLAAAAVMGGLFTSISVSDHHRKQATAGAVARDYAERIAGRTYVECATPSAYTVAPAAVPVPSGYTAVVDSVEFWTGTGWAGSCSSTGLQRITVVASSDDGRATERSVVVVRQP
jgi:prepilin-type N-terminal cleavage/methylation domain-containing protein